MADPPVVFPHLPVKKKPAPAVASPFPGYLTPAQQLALAKQQAQAFYQPYLDELRNQRAQALADAQRNAQFERDKASALAKVLGGVAPSVQGAYQEAGRDQTAFAQGFSDAMRSLATNEAGARNAELAKFGVPSELNVDASKGSAAGNALYGLGGYIPGQQFSREGAGFTAAASFLPATALGQGEQSAASALGAGQDAASKLDADIRSQLAGLAGKAQGYLGDIQGQQFDLAKYYDNRNYQRAKDAAKLKLDQQKLIVSQQNKARDFQLEVAKEKFSQQYDLTRLNQAQQKLALQKLTGDRNFQAKLQSLGIQDARLQLQAARLEQQKRTAGKKGGITANKLVELKQIAADTAADAFNGVIDDQGNFVPGSRRTYQQTIIDLVKHGVPLSVAQQALNRYWQPNKKFDQPGLVGRAKVKDGFILMPWEKDGEGRPVQNYQQRKKAGLIGADAGSYAPGPVGQRVVALAAEQLGQPYVWGGESRKEGGFDCSGLIDWAYRQAGIDLPGRLTSWSAAKMGRSVKGEPLRPGDLVISNGGKHVTMYVGNGRVIAAPHSGTVVQYQGLPRDVVDIRRILEV